MKKVLCVFIFIVTILLLGGCDSSNSIMLNNMSDLRINYFEGKNSNIYVNLCCGYREEVFAYDGVSTNPIECGVITLGFVDKCTYSSVNILLNVDGREEEYVLEKSPYEDVFMEDIGYILNKQNKISLKLKNQSDEIELMEVSSDFKVNYKKAIKIGADYFKDKIAALYFNGTFHAEGYLKIVSKIEYENKFWYFSVIDQSGKSFSCLIDVMSGKVISNQK